MGKKRKHEKTVEEIQRKIKKLQNQLDNRNESVPEEHINRPQDQHQDTPFDLSPNPELPLFINSDEDLQPPPSQYHSPYVDSVCYPPFSPPQPSTSSPQRILSPVPGTSREVIQPDAIRDQDLDEEILQLLGDAPKEDTPMGPPIHKDIAHRWQDILAKGLPKELVDNLLKGYTIPNNCDLLLAPALNPEVKAALHEAKVHRDSAIMNKQKQLGIALSALAGAIDTIICSDISIKQKLLKPISDACRILCDIHFKDTKLRRYYALTSINNKLKETLQETQRDKLLFGENVTEKVKTAKSIQQSGDALKHTHKSNTNRPRIVPNPGPSKGRLNFTPQHRKTNDKPNNQRRLLRPAVRRAPAQPMRGSARRPSPPPRTTTYRK